MAIKTIIRLHEKNNYDKCCGRLELNDNNVIVCFDENGIKQRITTNAKMAVLSEWIRMLGEIVPNDKIQDIYREKSGYQAIVDISRIIQNLPECVRKALKNERGIGYSLCGTVENISSINSSNIDNDNPLSGLEGDYYAFWFDPNLKDNSILGAYFHVEKCKTEQDETNVAIMAVLGIRDNETLFSEEIVNVFCPGTNYHDNYNRFKEKNRNFSKKYFWAEGKIELNSKLKIAEIILRTKINAKWNIWLDLSEYLSRRETEQYQYRGGIGLAVALTPSSGKFFCKMGIVRKSYVPLEKNDILKFDEVKKMLEIAPDKRNVIQMDLNDSRSWYYMFQNL